MCTETMGNDRRSTRTMESDGTKAHATSTSREEGFKERRSGKTTRAYSEDAGGVTKEEREPPGDTEHARRDLRAHDRPILSGASSGKQTGLNKSGDAVRFREDPYRYNAGGYDITRRNITGESRYHTIVIAILINPSNCFNDPYSKPLFFPLVHAKIALLD